MTLSEAAGVPTPAAVPAGHVVKLRSRGQTWTSPCLPAVVAEHHHGELLKQIEILGGGQGFISFATADGRSVDVRVRDVYAIEHGPALDTEATRRPASAQSVDTAVDR